MVTAISEIRNHGTTFEPIESPVQTQRETTEELLDKLSSSEASILIQVCQLTTLFLRMFPQLAERKRQQTEEMKQEYKKLTGKSADCIRTVGTTDFWTAVATSVAQVASSVLLGGNNENISRVVNEVIGRGPQFVGIYTSRVNADERTASNKLQRINSELIEISQNEQNHDIKNSLFQAQESARRLVEAASRSN